MGKISDQMPCDGCGCYVSCTCWEEEYRSSWHEPVDSEKPRGSQEHDGLTSGAGSGDGSATSSNSSHRWSQLWK